MYAARVCGRETAGTSVERISERPGMVVGTGGDRERAVGDRKQRSLLVPACRVISQHTPFDVVCRRPFPLLTIPTPCPH